MASLAKRPNGKYRARYRDPEGVEHARHFTRRRDAEAWIAEQVHKVTEGVWIDPRSGRRTFEEYATEWLEAQIQHRPSTAKATASRMRVHLIPAFGHRPIAAIQRSEVQAWVTERAQHLEASTVEGLYRLLAQVMLAATEDRVIASSPCRKITLPVLETGRVTIPAVEDLNAVLAVAPERYRALVLLEVATGMRVSELLGLTVDRVDFLRRVVTVDRQLVGVVAGQARFGPPKTKASARSIPVPQSTIDDLAAHLARWPGPMVFTNEQGFPLIRQRFHDLWTSWCATAKVTCRFHDLRHLYASSLIASGQSIKVIQQRLGHSSAAVTLDIYGHLLPSDEDGTRVAVEELLGELRTGRGL